MLGPAEKRLTVHFLRDDRAINIHWFLSLEDAHDRLDNWRREYNPARVHSSPLNNITQAQMIRALCKGENHGFSTALILGKR